MPNVYHSREVTERMLLIFKDNMISSLPGGDIFKRVARIHGIDSARENAGHARSIFNKALLRAGYTEDLKPYSDNGAPLLS
jgi:hypothetical protein